MNLIFQTVSHIPATRLILGGNFAERPYRLSCEILDAFAAVGGIFVETAADYADGRAEIEVGRLVADRPEMRVITKVGMRLPDGALAEGLYDQVEISVERLGRTVDLLLLHRDFAHVDPDEIMAPLGRAKASGLAAAVGVANWSAARVARVSDPAWVDAVSAQLSLPVPSEPLWPGTLVADDALLDEARRRDVPLLAWSANARGWIESRPADGEPPEPSRLHDLFDTDRNRRLRDRISEVGRSHSISPTGMALAWLLARYDGVRPVIGPASVDELRQSLAAAALTVDPGDVSMISQLRDGEPT